MGDLQPKSGDPALTVWQPFADLILAGDKDVENRGWPVPSTLPQRWRCGVCRTEWRCGFRGSSIDPAQGCPRGCSRMKDPDLLGPFPFRLWIHAAANPAIDQAAWDAWVRSDAVTMLPWPEYSQGRVVLGSVEVTGCHHADAPGCVQRDPSDEYVPCSPWAHEDCWHWTLTDPQPLSEPIPMRGRQKLWRIPEEVAAHG